ncbi:nucleoside 2-deoxyribosyltransferase [Micromonospora sp. ALFpr18c]|nr:nucleoside 2-deoxyribosyltransferase [Micromonospora sp. ALFpr18c]
MTSTSDTATATDITSVFVAGPFWALVDVDTGTVSGSARDRIESVLSHYDAKGATVYNAHRREAWGAAMLEPHQFTKLDYDEIAASDVVVGFPGVPASPGTHVEIGWASAMGKPMVLLLEEGVEYAGLVEGLPSFRPCELLRFSGRVDTGALDQAVTRVVARAAEL